MPEFPSCGRQSWVSVGVSMVASFRRGFSRYYTWRGGVTHLPNAPRTREDKMASAATSLLAAMALAIATTGAAAQDYPSRPVRIVVPYAAGGPSDTGTRLAAEPLARELGRPIVIENRGGGGGLNATEAYVKSEHDGYTILVGAIGPLTIIPALKPVSYDPEKDFAPLSTVWRSAQVLAVRPSLGVKSMAAFVAYARANPGK